MYPLHLQFYVTIRLQKEALIAINNSFDLKLLLRLSHFMRYIFLNPFLKNYFNIIKNNMLIKNITSNKLKGENYFIIFFIRLKKIFIPSLSSQFAVCYKKVVSHIKPITARDQHVQRATSGENIN